jgi:hypothetical protein
MEQQARDAKAPSASGSGLGEESRAWLRDLRSVGAARDDAIARLHALLLRAARFEVDRRRVTFEFTVHDPIEPCGRG